MKPCEFCTDGNPNEDEAQCVYQGGGVSVDLKQFEGMTPGPWRFDDGVYSGDVGFIMAANGSAVCRFGNSDPPEEPGVAPTGADRLLIENAPALLADLRAAREEETNLRQRLADSFQREAKLITALKPFGDAYRKSAGSDLDDQTLPDIDDFVRDDDWKLAAELTEGTK